MKKTKIIILSKKWALIKNLNSIFWEKEIEIVMQTLTEALLSYHQVRKETRWYWKVD